MHYYQFNIGDYASHTRHLSLYEDLAYRRLLDIYYLHERPLNGCVTTVARKIGMSQHEAEVEQVLNEFFDFDESIGWTQSRVAQDIAHYHAKQEQASRAGKASAQRKANVKQTPVEQPLNDRQTTVEPTNNQEPLTNNQLTPKAPKGADVRFEEFWKAYPKKIGKDAARRAFEKRKITAELMTLVMQSVRKQCQSDAWKKDDGQFIPHPATWLNQGRWQDEIDTATAAPAEQSLMTRGGVEELALKLGEPRWSQMIPFETYRRKILTLAQERGFV